MTHSVEPRDHNAVAEFDLHGYYPGDIYHGLLTQVVRQAWEMGASDLVLIHGHGRNRGITPGFVNTNTGALGLAVRSTLKNSSDLREWIYHSTIYRGENNSRKQLRLLTIASPT